MVNELIDTVAQVSLVAERSLNERSRFRRYVLKIHGIIGDAMGTIGQVDLYIGEICHTIFCGKIVTNELRHTNGTRLA